MLQCKYIETIYSKMFHNANDAIFWVCHLGFSLLNTARCVVTINAVLRHAHYIFFIGGKHFKFMVMHLRNYCFALSKLMVCCNCGVSSEFVSSSIPSWQILTAHAQQFRGARDLAFCLKVALDSLLVWASSGGSGETAQMRRLAKTFAARIGDKYLIRLTQPS